MFQYQIVDKDGDVSTANLQINMPVPQCTIDVEFANPVITHALLQNGFDIPLDITVTTNGTVDFIMINLGNAFGSLSEDVTLSAGTEVSEGMWQLTEADLQGLNIELPEGDPETMIDLLGGQWSQHNIVVTAHTTSGCVDTASKSIVLIASPLVLDLDGDGVEHTFYADDDILFDIDGNGSQDQTGWISADDGFLAIDLDGNGLIDDATELFGTNTTDGFSVLSNYDSNGDGTIDASDDVWAELVVWQDLNQDGVSQDGEMLSLDALGISSISLNSTVVDEWDNGNFISDTSTFTYDDGSTGIIEDVWFAYVSGAQSDVVDEVVEPDAVEMIDCELPICTYHVVDDTVEYEAIEVADALYGDVDMSVFYGGEDKVDTVSNETFSPDILEALTALDNAETALQDSINDFVFADEPDVLAPPQMDGPCLAGPVTGFCDTESLNLDDLVIQDVSTII